MKWDQRDLETSRDDASESMYDSFFRSVCVFLGNHACFMTNITIIRHKEKPMVASYLPWVHMFEIFSICCCFYAEQTLNGGVIHQTSAVIMNTTLRMNVKLKHDENKQNSVLWFLSNSTQHQLLLTFSYSQQNQR